MFTAFISLAQQPCHFSLTLFGSRNVCFCLSHTFFLPISSPLFPPGLSSCLASQLVQDLVLAILHMPGLSCQGCGLAFLAVLFLKQGKQPSPFIIPQDGSCFGLCLCLFPNGSLPTPPRFLAPSSEQQVILTFFTFHFSCFSRAFIIFEQGCNEEMKLPYIS